MHIPPTNSRFNKGSKDHRSSDDHDDNSGEATPIAVGEPSSDGEGPEEAAHLPWHIPGVGGAF